MGMTQNYIPPIEIIRPNRECVIRIGTGEGFNVIFKQVSRIRLDSQLLLCNWSVLSRTVLQYVTY